MMDERTAPWPGEPDGAEASLSLLVVWGGTTSVYPLPASGRLLIGRSAEADLRIDHPSVSREHAALLVGEELRIEDLGSANGTRVRESPLAPGTSVEVYPDDVIDLGAVLLVLQYRNPSARLRRICHRAELSLRIDEMLAEEPEPSSFALVRFDIERGLPAHAVQVVLASALRDDDLLAWAGGGRFEALLVDVTPEEADGLVRAVINRLAQRMTTARASSTCFPRDGREALLGEHTQHDTGQPAGARPRSIPGAWIVHDEAMLHVVRLLERIADSHLNVLLLGETGVGKEVCAELTHAFSSRAQQPLVRLNCASLSESLLDDELFGHERGAFTGASNAKPGLLETGSGGTVFLDEIGDIPLTTQLKLLRVLEAKEVRRLGSVKARTIDVRIVAATHRDLREAITVGRFREDLYYRLDGISVVVPPLRERLKDIEPLARHFAARVSRPGQPALDLAPETVEWLTTHEWPGNVRELRNTMERAAVLCDDGIIRIEHMRVHPSGERPAEAARSPSDTPTSAGLRAEVRELERARIERALETSGGNQRRAASTLGISRGALLRRIGHLGIPRSRKR